MNTYKVSGKPIDAAFAGQKEPRYIRVEDAEGTSTAIAVARSPQIAQHIVDCLNFYEAATKGWTMTYKFTKEKEAA